MNTTKTLFKIFPYSSMYMFVYFKTRFDPVTLVPLGAIGFDEFMVVDELISFGGWTVYNGVIYASNLMVNGKMLP